MPSDDVRITAPHSRNRGRGSRHTWVFQRLHDLATTAAAVRGMGSSYLSKVLEFGSVRDLCRNTSEGSLTSLWAHLFHGRCMISSIRLRTGARHMRLPRVVDSAPSVPSLCLAHTPNQAWTVMCMSSQWCAAG